MANFDIFIYAQLGSYARKLYIDMPKMRKVVYITLIAMKIEGKPTFSECRQVKTFHILLVNHQEAKGRNLLYTFKNMLKY